VAQIKCGFCQSTTFELANENIKDARHPLSIVRCSQCGVPIGVLQQDNPSETIRNAAQALSTSIGQIGAGLAKDMDQLKKDVAEILRRLPAPSP
jgi:hypothetical protein